LLANSIQHLVFINFFDVFSSQMVGWTINTTELSNHLEFVLDHRDDLSQNLALKAVILGFLFAQQIRSDESHEGLKFRETIVKLETGKIFCATQWLSAENRLDWKVLIFFLKGEVVRTDKAEVGSILGKNTTTGKTDIECFKYSSNDKQSIAQTMCGITGNKNAKVGSPGKKLSTLYYNFTFFHSLISEKNTQIDMVGLKQEVKSVLHNMQLYFSVLTETEQLLDYFTIFIFSAFQCYLKEMPMFHAHLENLKSFVIYFGNESANYISIDQNMLSDKKGGPCLFVERAENKKNVGIKVNIAIQTKITLEIDSTHDLCYQAFPSLLKIWFKNPKTAEPWLHASSNSLFEYLNKSHTEMNNFILGQFIYAACDNKNPNHVFWTSNSSENSSSFMLSDVEKNKTRGFIVRRLQNGPKLSIHESPSTEVGNNLLLCTKSPQMFDEYKLLEQFFEHASKNRQDQLEKINLADISAVMEGYHSKEWHVNTIEKTSSKIMHFLTNDVICSLLIIVESYSTILRTLDQKQKTLNLDIQDTLVDLFLSNPSCPAIRVEKLMVTEPMQVGFSEYVSVINQFVNRKNCSTYCGKMTTNFCKHHSFTTTKCYLTKKNISQNVLNNHNYDTIHNSVEESLYTLQWELSKKVWANYFFRDRLAINTVDIGVSDNFVRLVTAEYEKDIQQTRLPYFPQILLTIFHLFKLIIDSRRHLNEPWFQFDQQGLDIGHFHSIWHLNVFYTNEKFRGVVTTLENGTISSKFCRAPIMMEEMLEEALDSMNRSFSANKFANLRQLDIDGQYANGTPANDAFIFSADILPSRNLTISGLGGRDCVFMTRHDVILHTLQIDAKENRLDIVIQRTNSSDPIFISYNNVTVLKGRKNVADTITLWSCTLDLLDANGGEETIHDVIIIHQNHRPCENALKIFIRKHTTILNHAVNGTFIYYVDPKMSEHSSLLLKKPTKTFEKVVHCIVINSRMHEIEIKVHQSALNPDNIVFDIFLNKRPVFTIHYVTNSVPSCSTVQLIFTDGVVMTLDKTIEVAKESDAGNVEQFFSQSTQSVHGHSLVSSTTHISNETNFQYHFLKPTSDHPEPTRRQNSLSVFMIDPRYRSEIDYQGERFLVDITPDCVSDAEETDIVNLESCEFETVRLKRMPTEKLIITLKDLCFCLSEKQAIVEPSIFHDVPNAILEIKIEIVQQNHRTQKFHVGRMFVNLQQFANYRSEEILIELEAMMVVKIENKHGTLNLEPMPNIIDSDTELVVLLPKLTVRPVKFALNRVVHSYRSFLAESSLLVAAFECFKRVEVCVPTVTFILFDYNDDSNKCNFPLIEIVSQGANFKMQR